MALLLSSRTKFFARQLNSRFTVACYTYVHALGLQRPLAAERRIELCNIQVIPIPVYTEAAAGVPGHRNSPPSHCQADLRDLSKSEEFCEGVADRCQQAASFAFNNLSTEGSSSHKDRLQSHQVHLTMLQYYTRMQYTVIQKIHTYTK